MMVKIFTPNKYGKIEFTKEELEKLLDEVYNSGYSDGRSKYWYTWTSPSWNSPWYSTTRESTITSASTSNTIDNGEYDTCDSGKITINLGE